MNYRIYVIAAIVLSFLSLVFLSFGLSDKIEYTHTKAVCSGNECQDFLIVCSGGEVVEMQPLTGLIVFSDSWIDKRSEEEKKPC